MEILEQASLNEEQKNDIKFFIEYLQGKHDTKLSSRIIVIKGDAGLGKTYLVEHLVKDLGIKTYYAGQENITGKNIKNMESIFTMASKDFNENCLIFLDDLNYLMKENEFGEINDSSKRRLLKLLSKVKASKKRIGLIATANHLGFDDQIRDRFEVIIEMLPPIKETKKNYLKRKYNQYLSKGLIDNLALKSTGYNFRDMDEVVKKAYRSGFGKITPKSVEIALEKYEPTNYHRYNIIKNIDLKFKDVVGRDKIKKRLRQIMTFYDNRDKIEKYGLNRTNLIVFHGEPGLGKTHMAKAMAGEMDLPLINMNVFSIYGRSPLSSFNQLSYFSERFRDAIVLIDEADKLLGRSRFQEDGPLQGMLNEIFDGVNRIEDTIVIVSMNDIENFGRAFKDRFNIIEFDYPKLNERELYFKLKVDSHKNLFKDVDHREIAHLTKKMSFRDMERLWNKIVCHYIQNKSKVSMTTISRLISPKQKKPYYGMFG